MTEAARRLSISVKTLANWVVAVNSGKVARAGGARKPITELEAENSRLKRALAEMKMERDLLKSDGVLREGIAQRVLWTTQRDWAWGRRVALAGEEMRAVVPLRVRTRASTYRGLVVPSPRAGAGLREGRFNVTRLFRIPLVRVVQ